MTKDIAVMTGNFTCENTISDFLLVEHAWRRYGPDGSAWQI